MNNSQKKCKNCGLLLVKEQTKKTPAQLKKPYYYSAYYYCNSCHKLYHSEEFKVINLQTPIKSGQTTPLPFGSIENKESGETVVCIWTDGACVHNGTSRARAAWAFVSGTTEQAGLVTGKQTNNVAEGLAIYYALVWAAEQKHHNIRLHTDSQISLFNVHKPWEKVKVNQEIFRKIADVIQKNNLQVEYIKVLGHSGVEQNERVDKLANGMATKGV